MQGRWEHRRHCRYQGSIRGGQSISLSKSILGLTTLILVCWLQNHILRCGYLRGGKWQIYYPSFAFIRYPNPQTDTIQIPAGTQIVGEAWPVILGAGSSFNDQNNPKPVVQVGASGSTGTVEISGILFKTRGPGLCYFNTFVP